MFHLAGKKTIEFCYRFVLPWSTHISVYLRHTGQPWTCSLPAHQIQATAAKLLHLIR